MPRGYAPRRVAQRGRNRGHDGRGHSKGEAGPGVGMGLMSRSAAPLRLSDAVTSATGGPLQERAHHREDALYLRAAALELFRRQLDGQ